MSGAYDPAVELLVCCRRSLTSWSQYDMSAPYWRFYWNEQDGASILCAGGEIPLDPGRFYLLPPNMNFSGLLHRPVDHMYVHFLARAPYHRAEPELIDVPACPELLAMIRHKIPSTQQEEVLSRAGVMLSRAAVLYCLCHIPESRLCDRYADARVEAVIEWMERQYARTVTNDELAELAHMNTNAFIRRFGQVTGMSPQAYLMRIRIDQACVLLHHSEMSIEQIAQQTGFCDRYHFSRVFRQKRGGGPAAFRKARHAAT